MDSDFTRYDENFAEFDDVLGVLDTLKESVSDVSVNTILSFAKAYRVIQYGSNKQAEMIIN